MLKEAACPWWKRCLSPSFPIYGTSCFVFVFLTVTETYRETGSTTNRFHFHVSSVACPLNINIHQCLQTEKAYYNITETWTVDLHNCISEMFSSLSRSLIFKLQLGYITAPHSTGCGPEGFPIRLHKKINQHTSLIHFSLLFKTMHLLS